MSISDMNSIFLRWAWFWMVFLQALEDYQILSEWSLAININTYLVRDQLPVVAPTELLIPTNLDPQDLVNELVSFGLRAENAELYLDSGLNLNKISQMQYDYPVNGPSRWITLYQDPLDFAAFFRRLDDDHNYGYSLTERLRTDILRSDRQLEIADTMDRYINYTIVDEVYSKIVQYCRKVFLCVFI